MPGRDELTRHVGVRELIADPDASPLAVEQIAIEATNSLRGAEVGIRALRARPLLQRLWGSVTGKGAQLQAAVDADLVTAQRATLGLVREVMTEHARTRYCVALVVDNLSAVNSDVDALAEKVLSVEDSLSTRIQRVDVNLRREIRSLSERTASEIVRLDRRIDREGEVRRVTALYQGAALNPGAGDLLSSALYLAHTGRVFAYEPERIRSAERAAALSVVKTKIAGKGRTMASLLLEAASMVRPDCLELASFLLESARGPLTDPLYALIERRRAELPAELSHAEEAVVMASRLRDPERMLRRNIVTADEFADRLAAHFCPVEMNDDA